jgi:hypothetical protein
MLSTETDLHPQKAKALAIGLHAAQQRSANNGAFSSVCGFGLYFPTPSAAWGAGGFQAKPFLAPQSLGLWLGSPQILPPAKATPQRCNPWLQDLSWTCRLQFPYWKDLQRSLLPILKDTTLPAITCVSFRIVREEALEDVLVALPAGMPPAALP